MAEPKTDRKVSRGAGKAKAKTAGKKRSEASPKAPKGEKIAELVRLISRERGASLDELAEKLGWERHTVRGRISVLGKGMKIVSEKTETKGRVYRVA